MIGHRAPELVPGGAEPEIDVCLATWPNLARLEGAGEPFD